MKLWTMKITCVFGWLLKEPCGKLCEIQSTCDLQTVCDFILESFGFDNDHLHEFFISDSPDNRNRRLEDETQRLQAFFPLEAEESLFMNFDFGDDWVFQITLSETVKPAPFGAERIYPRVIAHFGNNPEQYPLSEE